MEQMDSRAELEEAVHLLAEQTQGFSDSDLGQPFQWGAHHEGVRFALIGALHELRTLAVQLAAERRRAGIAQTRAHHALAQYNFAYRDLAAVMAGVSDAEYEKIPSPGEWPLRYVYGHMVGTERHFFTLIHYGVRRQREGGDLPASLPEGEANRLLGAYDVFRLLMDGGTRSEMAAYHKANHDRALAEFAGISDAEIDALSLWGEGEPYSVEYRLHRMEAHLRQHTIQIEKTLDQLGHTSNEARRLIRLVFNALSEVEGAMIGAPALLENEMAAVATSIHRLSNEAVKAVEQANAMIAAVTSGNRERVAELITMNPRLANVISRDGVPIIRLALYYGQKEIGGFLADSPAIEVDMCDAAALGRLAMVEEQHKGWGDFILNEFSRDGYSPLQLACFFGHEEIARYLVEKGADIHAVSMNPMAIQPLHAATASDNEAIVRLLLEAGADPNAAQQDGFLPLHAAAQNGNRAIAELLLAHGADIGLTDSQGNSPRMLAEESGHREVAELLTILPSS